MPFKNKDKINNSVLANYVESLKIYLKDSSSMSARLMKVIDKMPSPSFIKNEMSQAEGDILKESVDWAWKEITGHKMIDELKINNDHEPFLGNYWILKNGIILEGINHSTIISKNIALFSSLLKINPMEIVGHMSNPNRLIKIAINEGAIRVYVNSNKTAYFQMSPETYKLWGRDKVKKFDVKEKIIRLVDLSKDYKGWSTGIGIRID